MTLLDQALNPTTAQNYAGGGMVGLQPPSQGSPAPSMGSMQQAQPSGLPGMQPPSGQPMDHKMFDMHTTDMLQRNPQVGQQIKSAIDQAIQSGELSPQQLQLAIQLCQAVMQNPALWPQLRQYAIRAGLAGPNDLPQQYDQGLVYAILIAAKAYTQGNHEGNYASGGLIQGPGTGTSDSIHTTNQTTGAPVNVSNGEYVIPAHVVAAKGKDFFDSLLRKYTPLHQGQK